MSNRDHERESLTRKIFVRPQTSDEPGDSSQEATRSLSLEELQEMGRQSKTDDYSAPTTQFTPSGPGAYGPSIQSQRSQQQQGTPQHSFPSPPVQPPPQPLQQSQPHQPQQPQPQVYPHAEPTKPKRKVPGVAIAMMVVAVVVALGICGYIVVDQLQRSDGNTQSANQPGGDNGSIGEGEGEDKSGDTGGSEEEAGEESGASEEGQGTEAKDVKAFMAPSSNIVCTIDADRARCTIREFDFDPGDAPNECDVDPFGSVVVVEKDGAGFSCVNRGLPTEANVLDYGESISAHGFTCRSGEDGMTCESSEGHKFRVARAAANFD